MVKLTGQSTITFEFKNGFSHTYKQLNTLNNYIRCLYLLKDPNSQAKVTVNNYQESEGVYSKEPLIIKECKFKNLLNIFDENASKLIDEISRIKKAYKLYLIKVLSSENPKDQIPKLTFSKMLCAEYDFRICCIARKLNFYKDFL